MINFDEYLSKLVLFVLLLSTITSGQEINPDDTENFNRRNADVKISKYVNAEPSYTGHEYPKMYKTFPPITSKLHKLRIRQKRDTFSQRFSATLVCDISEEELQFLSAFLINAQLVSTKISQKFTLHGNESKCNRLILEIKNSIIDLKINYDALNQPQVTFHDFTIMKQSYETELSELHKKINNIQRRMTQSSRTQMDSLQHTIKQLQFESTTHLTNLEKVKREHLETKVQLCKLQIKNDRDFSECINLLDNNCNNETFLQYVMKISYSNNITNITPIIKLIWHLKYLESALVSFETLIDEMIKNGDQYSPLMFEIHYYILRAMRGVNYNSSSKNTKSGFERIKTKASNQFPYILNTWASQIRSNNYKQIIEFQSKYIGAFENIADQLITNTYDKSPDHIANIITFLGKGQILSCVTIMAKTLFDEMKSNGHVFSEHIMRLAGYVKHILDTFSASNEFYSHWRDLKYKFPSIIRKLMWDANRITISNTYYNNEYLYAASWYHSIRSHGRTVYSWGGDSIGDDCWWRITTIDYGMYFLLYNIYYDGYLYDVGLNMEIHRAYLSYGISYDITLDQYSWKIIPTGDNTFVIKNKKYDRYLYGGSQSDGGGSHRRFIYIKDCQSADATWTVA